MSSPFIIIDEITEKIDEINTSLTTKIDTISGNTTTIINNTKVNNTASGTGSLSQKLSWIGNTLIGATGHTGGSATAGTVMAKLNAAITNTATNNTASTTGTLSQKISSAIANTAATTTENSSGTLSAKLSYLINRRNKIVTPSGTNLKTLNSSGTITTPAKGSQNSTDPGEKYTNGTTYSTYAKHSGRYRASATASIATVSTSTTSVSGYEYIGLQCGFRIYVTVYHGATGSHSSHQSQDAKGTSPLASTTKTCDFNVEAGDLIQVYIRAFADPGVWGCEGIYYWSQFKLTWTDISIRGTVNELNGAVT